MHPVLEDLPPISRRDQELVKSHRRYLRKIYLIGNLTSAFVLLQWVCLKPVSRMETFSEALFDWQQYVIWLAFLGLLIFMFFFKEIRKTSLFNAWLSAGIAAEIAAVILVQPLRKANYKDIIYSGLLMLIFTIISLPLSLQLQEEVILSQTHLELWTGRYFLICSMAELIFKSLREDWVSIFASVAIIWFLASYMFDFAKSIGSLEFYYLNRGSYILFGTLMYFNLISLFSICVVFLTALRTVEYN